MKRLTVSLPSHRYEILIDSGILDALGAQTRKVLKAQKALIVTDENVAPLYLARAVSSLEEAGIKALSLVLPAGEATKSLSHLSQIYDALCENGLSRTDVLVALGGGVIGDLAGFAAATYLRGVPYVQAPTSLLAQVDSAVGGKVAIDLPQGKNLAGAFYHPALVVLDPDTLQTLPDRVFLDGMGEVVKYGCIADERLFALIEQNPSRAALMQYMEEIIARCLDIKRAVVEEDERDTGARMALNFGHTLGHAIEASQRFMGLRHGEAVCAGMALITRLSEQEGLTEEGTAQRLTALLEMLGLPISAPANEALLNYLKMDKKNLNGQLNCVLLKRVGEHFIYPTNAAFFEGAQAWLI